MFYVLPCINIQTYTIKIISKRQCSKYLIACSALGLLWLEIFVLHTKICSYFLLQFSHEQQKILPRQCFVHVLLLGLFTDVKEISSKLYKQNKPIKNVSALKNNDNKFFDLYILTKENTKHVPYSKDMTYHIHELT